MPFYTFHELLLEVVADGAAGSASLTQLLRDLSWRAARHTDPAPGAHPGRAPR